MHRHLIFFLCTLFYFINARQPDSSLFKLHDSSLLHYSEKTIISQLKQHCVQNELNLVEIQPPQAHSVAVLAKLVSDVVILIQESPVDTPSFIWDIITDGSNDKYDAYLCSRRFLGLNEYGRDPITILDVDKDISRMCPNDINMKYLKEYEASRIPEYIVRGMNLEKKYYPAQRYIGENRFRGMVHKGEDIRAYYISKLKTKRGFFFLKNTTSLDSIHKIIINEFDKALIDMKLELPLLIKISL